MKYWRINDLFHSGRRAGQALINKTTKHRGASRPVQSASNIYEMPDVTLSPSSSPDSEKDCKTFPDITGRLNVTFKRGEKVANIPGSSNAAFEKNQPGYFRSFAEFGFHFLSNSVRLAIAEAMKALDTTSSKVTECVESTIKNSAKKAGTSLEKHGSCIENAGKSIESGLKNIESGLKGIESGLRALADAVFFAIIFTISAAIMCCRPSFLLEVFCFCSMAWSLFLFSSKSTGTRNDIAMIYHVEKDDDTGR